MKCGVWDRGVGTVGCGVWGVGREVEWGAELGLGWGWECMRWDGAWFVSEHVFVRPNTFSSEQVYKLFSAKKLAEQLFLASFEHVRR